MTATDNKQTVTFMVSECGEYHSMGEFHEGIKTIGEAKRINEGIDPDRLHAIPAVGINIHTEGTPDYEDTEWDFYTGNIIDLTMLEYLPQVTECRDAIRNTSENGAKTKIVYTAPKSNHSIRVIPLPKILMKYLEPSKQKDTFFLTGTEKCVEPRVMQNQFKDVLTDAGISSANFHALRHTFATNCIEVGFDIKCLSEILGHSSVNITLNRYVHPSMNLKHENMAKLEKV